MFYTKKETVDVNLEELKLGRGSGLGVRADVYEKKSGVRSGGVRSGGQGGCVRRIEVIVKMRKSRGRVDVYEELK